MAVGRVDVVAQPDSGVGDLQRSAAEPAGDPRRGFALRLGAMLEAQRLSRPQRHPFDQRIGETVVVVSGDEDDLAPGERRAELFEEGPGALHRGAERQFAQLQGVAEQDEPVGRRDLLEQQAADLRVAQQVLAEGAAQVQVGDDRGEQAANLLPVHVRPANAPG